MYKIAFNDGQTLTPSKIIGVGLNYAAHIEEMNNQRPDEPVLFIKPNSALCDINKPLIIPKEMGSVHHEVELAVCIKKECRGISQKDAPAYIGGFALALDLTLRDKQSVAKAKGRPWSVAKGFDNSCPITTFYKKNLSDLSNNTLTLKVNDIVKQSSSTRLMLFKIDELMAYISKIFTLLPGDIIITGTPAGVGPLSSGDKIAASIENLVSARTYVS